MIFKDLFKVFIKIKYLLILSIFISKVVSDDEDEFHPNAEVHSLDNDRVGNGGAVITIHGRDFAEDTFNQFDPNIGNKVCINLETLEISKIRSHQILAHQFLIFQKVFLRVFSGQEFSEV